MHPSAGTSIEEFELIAGKWKQTEKSVLALDIDGVLIHPSEELDGGRWDSRMRQDLGMDPASLHQAFFAKYWPEIITGQRDLKEDLATALSDIRARVSVEQVITYWFERDARADHTVAALVQEWRRETGGRSVAVSNQEKYRVAYLRDHVGLGQLVDCIFWSGDMGVTKTDPKFYVLATDKLGVEPSQIWFFDDDHRNVEMAAAAGWNAFQFVDVQHMRSALASDNQPSRSALH
jgi:HAD superfamily hydrolase (TIGR01509 family)